MTGKPHRWLAPAPGEPFAPQPFEPAPGDEDVVVAVAGCGVCHTDVGFHFGGVGTHHPYPLALGHEISGRVVDAGPSAKDWIGRAVVVPAVIPCGRCAACEAGRPTICLKQTMPGNHVHGGFASHVQIPARGLCPVDEKRLGKAGLELWQTAVVADALTTPLNALKEADVGPGSFVVVVGAGGIGSGAVRIAAAMGARVVAVDTAPGKLEPLRDHATVLEATDGKALRAQCRKLAPTPIGWIILECSGTRAGQEAAFGLMGPGATLSVVGFTMDKATLRLSNLMAFHARAQGTWGCPPALYPEALDLVLSGKVPVAPFVERHPMRAINAVFEKARAQALEKRAVLVPGE